MAISGMTIRAEPRTKIPANGQDLTGPANGFRTVDKQPVRKFMMTEGEGSKPVEMTVDDFEKKQSSGIKAADNFEKKQSSGIRTADSFEKEGPSGIKSAEVVKKRRGRSKTPAETPADPPADTPVGTQDTLNAGPELSAVPAKDSMVIRILEERIKELELTLMIERLKRPGLAPDRKSGKKVYRFMCDLDDLPENERHYIEYLVSRHDQSFLIFDGKKR